jgi:DNA-binding MarR family transcriptional regulator
MLVMENTYSIGQDEFMVLAYLHEHAEAFDKSSSFNVRDIAAEIGISERDVKKAASYLSSLGLAVMHQPIASSFAEEGQKVVYLTGIGEQIMRKAEQQLVDELNKAPERQPGTVQKITVKVGAFVWGLAQPVIVKIVSDKIEGRIK